MAQDWIDKQKLQEQIEINLLKILCHYTINTCEKTLSAKDQISLIT